MERLPAGFKEMLSFGLIDALLGRRSRPSIFLITYLQAHHLDLEFYDRFYKPGAYLKTHADHMTRWHSRAKK